MSTAWVRAIPVVFAIETVLNGAGSPRTITPVTDHTLARPSPNDWLSWRGTGHSLGYSPLTQINRDNVGQLKPVWSRPMTTGWQEAAPIVHDGVMFLAHNGGMVDALDAATGDRLWTYTPPAREGQPSGGTTRGMAIYGTHVFVTVPDGRLVAIDAATGSEAWSTLVAQPGTGFKYATAPVVARGGKIVTAFTACDRYMEEKCSIVGHDATTGRELWRTSTIPKPGTPGGDSWGGLDYVYRVGTDMWIPGSYDPELNLVYWSTSQAKPWARASRGSGDGDALYSNSTLALDPNTGRIVWHRQFLPGETHDLDEVFENVLVDDGARHSLFKMGKIGILWEVDRRTGKIVRATDLGLQNILDLNPRTGAVKYHADKLPKLNTPLEYCPAPVGGKNWPAMSYSPDVKAIFIPYLQTCANMTFLEVPKKPGGGGRGGGQMRFWVDPRAQGNAGVLAALDLNGQVLWKHEQRAPFVSATLATAGGLVFVADYNQQLYAFDTRTGKIAWQTALETNAHGFPASYAVNGRQYIAVPMGGTTVLDMYAPQMVPEFTPAKADNTLVVYALPQVASGAH